MCFEIDLGNGHFALVDPEDYEHLAGFRWRTRAVRYSKENDAGLEVASVPGRETGTPKEAAPLIRDIFGNPYRPLHLRRWRD
jgi:hypothetical protein